MWWQHKKQLWTSYTHMGRRYLVFTCETELETMCLHGRCPGNVVHEYEEVLGMIYPHGLQSWISHRYVGRNPEYHVQARGKSWM